MTLRLVRNKKPRSALVTHVESVTDRAGLGQLEATMRRYRKKVTGSHIEWIGNGDARFRVSKLSDDQYRLIYSARYENDPEMISVFAAVCCKKELKIHRNCDDELHDRLRAAAVGFQADHRAAPARSFFAAAALFAIK